jgi:hypothetical protein
VQSGRVATLQPYLLVRSYTREDVTTVEYSVEESYDEIVQLNQPAALKASFAEMCSHSLVARILPLLGNCTICGTSQG